MRNLFLSFCLILHLGCAASLTPGQKLNQEIEFLGSTQQLVTNFKVNSEEHRGMILPLIAEAKLRVKIVRLVGHDEIEPGYFGWTKWENGVPVEMVIDSSLPGDTQVMTLLHELAHVKHGPFIQPGPLAEVIAETIAYQAGMQLGIDTRVQSLSYLAQFDAPGIEEALRVFHCPISQWASELAFAATAGRSLRLEGFEIP